VCGWNGPFPIPFVHSNRVPNTQYLISFSSFRAKVFEESTDSTSSLMSGTSGSFLEHNIDLDDS
jgi:hypothetical protein